MLKAKKARPMAATARNCGQTVSALRPEDDGLGEGDEVREGSNSVSRCIPRGWLFTGVPPPTGVAGR